MTAEGGWTASTALIWTQAGDCRDRLAGATLDHRAADAAPAGGLVKRPHENAHE